MIGKRISHYHIIEKLGGGGMGVVYKAQDERLDRMVALKFLRADLGDNEDWKHRFVHEAKAASALDHPNIGTVYDIEEIDDDQMFIAQAFYAGQTLEHRIEKGSLSPEEALDFACQIADGLTAAHDREIVHRDMKPANIMITDNGELKIIDFGLAKLGYASKITTPGSTMGTLPYMSPEVLNGLPSDERADLWGLGVILFEMVTGNLPFDGANTAALIKTILTEEPNLNNKSQSELPKPLLKVLDRALEKDPAKRYSSAEEFGKELKSVLASMSAPVAAPSVSVVSVLKRPVVFVPVIAIVVVTALFGYRIMAERAQIDWARNEAIPQITELIETDELFQAFVLAQKAEHYLGDDVSLAKLIDETSIIGRFDSAPTSASLYIKDYGKPEQDWLYVGETPLEGVRFPRGALRFKIEKPGYADSITAGRGRYLGRENLIVIDLFTPDELPANMIEIPTWDNLLQLAGLAKTDSTPVPSFLIDQYEVTNAAYRKFMDVGGYENQEYWDEAIIRDGEELPFQVAMELFRDKTGRTGPSSWEGGTFGKGLDSHPVSGVSWYEAAAYAKWVGKRLPTVFHWQNAAFPGFGEVIKFSNFGGQGTRAVGSSPDVGIFGIHDAAGNVKEWCANGADAVGGLRYILGGAYSDPQYMYTLADAQPALDRSPANGFRCIQYGANDPPDWVGKTIPRATNKKIDLSVPDETFEIFEKMYSYDRTPFNEEVMTIESKSEHWGIEKITYDAPYGGERLSAYLYLPKNVEPPYQTLVVFPGLNAFGDLSSEFLAEGPTGLGAAVVQSGRAVIWPIYKGSYERNMVSSKPELHQPFINPFQFFTDEPIAYRDWMVQAVKDTRRTFDYLESRSDIDADKLGYWGVSLGTFIGTITLGIEERAKVGILMIGGLVPEDTPMLEVEPAIFAPRITAPTLMLNGKLDFVFPVETGQKPLYELIGTADEDKNWITYDDVGHEIPPRVAGEFLDETLAWLDKYLGRVE